MDSNSKRYEESDLAVVVQQEYRDYQIYTLMDRAIPYLKDGLKPGQRRILYILYKNMNKGLLKVSGATGMVLVLHPHGPASIESSIVNLAQDYTFSNNYPILDKKGYFGERMETQAAAGRYIECKLNSLMAEILFDDLNQVKFVPNYDDREMEPEFLLPKLPLMLLNGAEGIGTGFATNIPSFNHREVIESIISILKGQKTKKLKPWVDNYNNKIIVDKEGKIHYSIKIEKINNSYYITELPKGYDAKKINRQLLKWIEDEDSPIIKNFKDYNDNSVDNKINIELIFKKGSRLSLDQVQGAFDLKSSMVPNYTLVDNGGVRIFKEVQEILNIFVEQRLSVVKERYRLKVKECEEKIKYSNEIIRFIKEKQQNKATTLNNRQALIQHLKKNKYFYAEKLADLPIYRFTKEEVQKRQLLLKEENKKLKEYQKIYKSSRLIKTKLIEELTDLDEKLNKFLRDKNTQKKSK